MYTTAAPIHVSVDNETSYFCLHDVQVNPLSLYLGNNSLFFFMVLFYGFLVTFIVKYACAYRLLIFVMYKRNNLTAESLLI